jgi:predicted metal-dependent phosphoesterase TrpH
MNRYECDLHCHTVRSDGNATPQELIDKAADLGMMVIAITDHDITPPTSLCIGNKTINICSYANEKGLELVLGYEFSCDTYVDDVHILGYGLRWDEAEIVQEVKRAKESKTKSYEKLCKVLIENGMPVDYENEILKYFDKDGNERFRKPDEVQRKHIFEVMAKKGYAPSWKEAKLLVRDNPTLNIRREKIDPLDAIELIKKCGGVAVLAHPFLIDETIVYPDGKEFTRFEYIKRLIDNGLDGIEANYPYSKTSYKGKSTNVEIAEEVKETFYGKVEFFTGGSDYHAEERKGMTNARFIGEGGISYKEFEKIKDYLIRR